MCARSRRYVIPERKMKMSAENAKTLWLWITAFFAAVAFCLGMFGVINLVVDYQVRAHIAETKLELKEECKCLPEQK